MIPHEYAPLTATEIRRLNDIEARIDRSTADRPSTDGRWHRTAGVGLIGVSLTAGIGLAITAGSPMVVLGLAVVASGGACGAILTIDPGRRWVSARLPDPGSWRRRRLARRLARRG